MQDKCGAPRAFLVDFTSPERRRKLYFPAPCIKLGSVLQFRVACYFLEVIILRPHYGHDARILHWCIDQTMTNALAQMDLTAAQGHIMGYLAHRQTPPCPRDLEEAFHLSHPTVSGLLARLEKKGFISLQPDEQDRRCKRIHILPKGRQCHQHMHETIMGIENKIVQDFTPEEKALFSRFLNRAIENLGGSPCHKEETNE